MKTPALKLSPDWKTAVKAWFLAKFGRDAEGKITLLSDSIFKLSSTLLVWVQGFRPTFIPASVVAKLATAPKLSKAEKYAQKKAQERQAKLERIADLERTGEIYINLNNLMHAHDVMPRPQLWAYEANALLNYPDMAKAVENLH
jgi:hypothetical protein